MDTLPQDIVKYEIFPRITYQELGRIYQTHKMFHILTKEEYEKYKDMNTYIIRHKIILKTITPYKSKGSRPILDSSQLEYINSQASFDQLVEIIQTKHYCNIDSRRDTRIWVNNNPQSTNNRNVIHLRILKNIREYRRSTRNIVYDLDINIYRLAEILTKN